MRVLCIRVSLEEDRKSPTLEALDKASWGSQTIKYLVSTWVSICIWLWPVSPRAHSEACHCFQKLTAGQEARLCAHVCKWWQNMGQDIQ